jgi:hypothetical protein
MQREWEESGMHDHFVGFAALVLEQYGIQIDESLEQQARLTRAFPDRLPQIQRIEVIPETGRIVWLTFDLAADGFQAMEFTASQIVEFEVIEVNPQVSVVGGVGSISGVELHLLVDSPDYTVIKHIFARWLGNGAIDSSSKVKQALQQADELSNKIKVLLHQA